MRNLIVMFVTRCLFSLSLEIEMAEKQEFLYTTCVCPAKNETKWRSEAASFSYKPLFHANLALTTVPKVSKTLFRTALKNQYSVLCFYCFINPSGP